MTNYTITTNHTYNSREISFDAKPSDAIREALKALKMRWNSKKSVWYGFASERDIIDAIQSNTPEEESAQILTEGYMGGGAVYGSKSNRHLSGSDLSAAIRADLKKAGIKNVSVKCNAYSMRMLRVTVRVKPDEILPFELFSATYNFLPRSDSRIFLGNDDKPIQGRDYYDFPGEEQEKIREKAMRYAYESFTKCSDNYCEIFSSCDFLTPDAQKKIEEINKIVSAYRYDNSNSMVDYFDTNFYYDVCIKPVN